MLGDRLTCLGCSSLTPPETKLQILSVEATLNSVHGEIGQPSRLRLSVPMSQSFVGAPLFNDNHEIIGMLLSGGVNSRLTADAHSGLSAIGLPIDLAKRTLSEHLGTAWGATAQ
jgi:hypothetical protein